MCYHSHLDLFTLYAVRDQSILVVPIKRNSRTKRVDCIIVFSNNPSYPAGMQFTWKNDMGHVLCDGNDEDEQDQCNLHPLDVESSVSWNTDWAETLVEAAKKLRQQPDGKQVLEAMIADQPKAKGRKRAEPIVSPAILEAEAALSQELAGVA